MYEKIERKRKREERAGRPNIKETYRHISVREGSKSGKRRERERERSEEREREQRLYNSYPNTLIICLYFVNTNPILPW